MLAISLMRQKATNVQEMKRLCVKRASTQIDERMPYLRALAQRVSQVDDDDEKQ